MNSKKILKLISEAKKERDKYLEGRTLSKYLKNTGHVLDLMKEEIEGNIGDPLEMNPRVFSGFRDICIVTVKGFEDTDLERSIMALMKGLEEEIPEFKNLGPLRMDFGKGDPI